MEKVRYGSIPIFIFLCCCLQGSEQTGSKGGWGEWGNVSGCSKSCGMGLRTRMREWIPGQGEPPLEVPFTNTEQFTCFMSTCPQNGSWSQWGMWGECTRACGEGTTRDRHRDCNNPPPENGGSDCEGEKFDREDCDSTPCPTIPPSFNKSVCKDTESYYMCDSKEMCVHVRFVCDGTLHCSDGTDEAGCWRKEYKLGHIRFFNHASDFYHTVHAHTVFLTVVAFLMSRIL